MSISKKKILFLCTGNSCRSQMAEGWGQKLLDKEFDCASAGVEKHGLNPIAVSVMKESGVDISAHFSKLVNQFNLIDFDYIVTVCDHAQESCPLVTAPSRHIHKSFTDPPMLAQNLSTDEEILDCYRRVRDEIKSYIITLPETLGCLKK